MSPELPRDQLNDIPNRQASNISSEAIFDACHQAEEMVFEVMESLAWSILKYRPGKKSVNELPQAYPFQI